MPINVQGNPSISLTPSGTQNVKIVSWDSTASLPAGSNLIGIVSISGTQNNVIVASLPAGNQIVGTMVVSSVATIATGTVSVVAIATTADAFVIPTGGSIRYGTSSTSVQFSRINILTSGDAIVVTSAANKSIVVLSLVLNGNGANSAVIASSVSANPIGPTFFLATSGVGAVLNDNQHGWFRTTVGHSLVINLASSGSVAGSLTYVAVTT